MKTEHPCPKRYFNRQPRCLLPKVSPSCLDLKWAETRIINEMALSDNTRTPLSVSSIKTMTL
jgi:hypothetical protein